ncbi:hypothetical protein ALT_0484 [Aspergillus lentulus]|uniref:Altered inheritance of mitochondria protein 9, mitochondrial n=1 Tax=Aspergillus lentulus TaxID=293939 RepID=A0AAN6BQ54_ASPLE|nr:hypothetical protein CNMCM6069_001403 [Aspergillus lentulus]KAF4168225.1 hypothetical protein CNMCM6936_003013 [Aspergillus lentulus]KAF4175326.1 hypothetical protein CNMCM8060_007416 [Aspergillus lentulus]KAF4184371.1 hypothetical protein CNMCM7927_008080 [Aspergillus lentulus]KAF4198970.1 hypothetical protein CNMCM8694_007576 [Aspergillus lentulus]
MTLYWGSWRNLSDYATTLGINERMWTMQNAQPRMNHYRSNTDPEMPSEYIDLIEKYLRVVPHLTQYDYDAGSADLLQPTVWHSDLHLNNVYVGLNTGTMTDIIDWQHTTVAPLILQARKEEKKLHEEKMENRDYVERLMAEFQEAGILPADGIVDPQGYENMQKTNYMQKEKFMSLAESEEQREWMDKICPYQDRPEEA